MGKGCGALQPFPIGCVEMTPRRIMRTITFRFLQVISSSGDLQ